MGVFSFHIFADSSDAVRAHESIVEDSQGSVVEKRRRRKMSKLESEIDQFCLVYETLVGALHGIQKYKREKYKISVEKFG